MTNKKQIQTKKISFILALSVIIYAAIDTYLFLCHDINIMRITTPVILGLVIAIILCGLLHNFFYKWLTKNPINFSLGEPSTPIVKSENIIESMDATETQPIKQPMDLPEQESSPSQQSNQDTVNSDCPQDSHLNKYDSILVELKKKEIESYKKYKEMLNIKANSCEDLITSLSGGNQQKVFLARWLNTDAEILLLDNPTQGIDVGAKAEIYKLILELAKQGKTILINTLEIPEIQKVADYCAVFYNGEIIKILEHQEIDEMTVMMYSTNAAQAEEGK